MIEIAESLARSGVSVTHDWLAPATLGALATEARAAFRAGRFHAAGVGGGEARALRPDVRGDHVLWLDGATSDAQHAYLAQMEAVRSAINERLFLGLFDFECHFAFYPAGSFYQRHVDRFRDDSRRTVSTVLYLNEAWEPGWGGALRLYESERRDAPYRDVVPRGGTLVCFLSDSTSHEVLPTTRERLSLTGWFRRRA